MYAFAQRRAPRYPALSSYVRSGGRHTQNRASRPSRFVLFEIPERTPHHHAVQLHCVTPIQSMSLCPHPVFRLGGAHQLKSGYSYSAEGAPIKSTLRISSYLGSSNASYLRLMDADLFSASQRFIASIRCLCETSWKVEVRGNRFVVRLPRKRRCVWRWFYRLLPKIPPCVYSDSLVGEKEMAEEREASVRSSGISERRVGTWWVCAPAGEAALPGAVV